MNNNQNAIRPVKALFGRNSILTLGISLAALSVFLLLRNISAAVYGKQLDLYSSLYYMFGPGSVSIVNIVMGVLTAGVIFAIAAGLFSSRFAIIKSEKPSASTLNFLKTAVFASIILTILLIIFSFASVAVINYRSIPSTIDNYGYSSDRYSTMAAQSLFWLTIIFGALILMAEISFLRLLFAMTRTLNDQGYKKNGVILSTISAIAAAFTTAITFAVTLFKLVTPSGDYAYNISRDLPVQGLEPSQLILDTLNVIVFAAATVAFIAMAVYVVSFAIDVDTQIRRERSVAYSQTHSVISPVTYPDYSTPQNYNYHQSPNFAPYYQANQQYENVYKNIYTGEPQPVPEPVSNPFMPPHPQKPSQSSVQPPVQPSVQPSVQPPVQPSVQPSVSAVPTAPETPKSNP